VRLGSGDDDCARQEKAEPENYERVSADRRSLAEDVRFQPAPTRLLIAYSDL
jgi:hypothetical protein